MKPRVLVIGSGFGGLAAAIELKKAGYDDIVVLEKAHEVGGVWRENTYPGAACDVPTPLYSYSFEPNPDWPRRFAPQPEILRYLRRVADKYDVRRHIRFGSEVTSCEWNDDSHQWTVNLTDGEQFTGDVLVPAMGQLSRPSYPAIDGIDTFAGPAFHSATWDHDIDLRGQNIAVIGTGASAIQFVPQIQPEAASLTLFQRTPPYIAPRWDTDYGPRHHALFRRLPFIQKGERGGWWAYLELVTTSFTSSALLSTALTAYSRWHMKKQTAAKPGLFDKVWPDYPIGCKRILISDDYLPALAQPNASVVTERIAAVEPGGVRTQDDVLHPADVIIYGTGFAAADFLAPIKFTGRNGLALADVWSEGAKAYYGLAVPGFPNLLMMYGPNTNTGAGSIIYFLETQARYIREYVDSLARTGAPLEVRPDVAEKFDAETQARLSGSVWTKCSSWYRNANGRITTNWPGISAEYRRRVVFRAEDYEQLDAASVIASPEVRPLSR